MFYNDNLPSIASQSAKSALSPVIANESPSIGADLSSDLRAVLIDMNRFCTLLNREPKHFRLQAGVFQSILILFAYRVLQLHPLSDDPPGDAMEYAVQISLLGFLTTVLFENGRMHTRQFDLLANRLHDALSSLLPRAQLRQQPALLWILFTGATALFGPEDATWLKQCIRSCLSTLKIDNWEDARHVLVKLPWIHVIHDRPALSVWQAIMADEENFT
jgi:hypothetical protein